ncbi:AprI/Inh family metalloprotease inhibitor [Bosea sp. 2KB_26]|uniref:AprI/Inh family metalloprotease inhibitor n=1 Tax=Bosea sp. 2KB_26 TaxID=3237475 RepID=UPI000DE4FF51
MKLRHITIAASSVLLGACNSAGYYYHSTGPWGPRNVYRTPPGYAAPWADPPYDLVETEPYIDAGGFDPVVRDVTPPAGRVIVGLPPDPIPTGPRSAPEQYEDTDLPQQGEVRAERPQPVRRLATSQPSASQVIPPPTSPSAYAGSWRAVDAGGKTCRVQLSTTSSIDLYKATVSGCAGSPLQSVNLWSFSGGNVTLYSREKVVARLSGQEASLSGPIEAGGTLRLAR